MADRRAVRAALEQVVDPLLGRPVALLGFIQRVDLSLFGPVKVVLRLPTPNYPVDYQELMTEAGSQRVEIEIEVMTDGERADLMSRLRAGSGPAIGQSGSSTRVVAVGSGKGGVGKSSVTTNLAIALSEAGHRVGVIDADIWGFSIPRMLGIRSAPVVIDQSIVPPVAHGVKAMSMDYFVGDDQAVIWRGPMLHKAIEQFLTDVFWDSPDFLLVDMPPGTGDIAISLSQFLPRAQLLLVTTPQPTAQRVARRAAAMALKVDQELLGVVENMSWFTGDDGRRYPLFGEGGGAALAEELGVPLMAQVPLITAMGRGADEGLPVSLAAPESEAAAAFSRLAAAVAGRKPRVRTNPQLVIR